MAQSFATARFLTVQEVADIMRVSTMTVYRIIKSGELPAVRVGRSFRVRDVDVLGQSCGLGGSHDKQQACSQRHLCESERHGLANQGQR